MTNESSLIRIPHGVADLLSHRNGVLNANVSFTLLASPGIVPTFPSVFRTEVAREELDSGRSSAAGDPEVFAQNLIE